MVQTRTYIKRNKRTSTAGQSTNRHHAKKAKKTKKTKKADKKRDGPLTEETVQAGVQIHADEEVAEQNGSEQESETSQADMTEQNGPEQEGEASQADEAEQNGPEQEGETSQADMAEQNGPEQEGEASQADMAEQNGPEQEGEASQADEAEQNGPEQEGEANQADEAEQNGPEQEGEANQADEAEHEEGINEQDGSEQECKAGQTETTEQDVETNGQEGAGTTQETPESYGSDDETSELGTARHYTGNKSFATYMAIYHGKEEVSDDDYDDDVNEQLKPPSLPEEGKSTTRSRMPTNFFSPRATQNDIDDTLRPTIARPVMGQPIDDPDQVRSMTSTRSRKRMVINLTIDVIDLTVD